MGLTKKERECLALAFLSLWGIQGAHAQTATQGKTIIFVKEQENTFYHDRAKSWVIFLDQETGCQYLKIGGIEALTPRLASDGKPLCNGGK